MRQIKFRGRLRNTGQVVYFDLFDIAADLSPPFFNFLQVDTNSIEQFIATDKNGYDVYEGDTLIDDLEQEHIAEIYDRPQFLAQLELKR